MAHIAHLNVRDTTLVYVSRAPQADLERLKARKGEPLATRWRVLSETVADAGLRQIGCTVGRELARV